MAAHTQQNRGNTDSRHGGEAGRAVQPSYLRRTPPSREALRHSGGESRLCTSATVTLYLDVELSRESLPGTEQNTSLGLITTPINPSFWQGRLRALFFVREMGPAGGGGKAGILKKGKINKKQQVSFLSIKTAQERGFCLLLNSHWPLSPASICSTGTERSPKLFLTSWILPLDSKELPNTTKNASQGTQTPHLWSSRL